MARTTSGGKLCLAGLLSWLGFLACATSAAAQTVQFVTGTYYLSANFFGTPDDTVTLTVSGGVASFDIVGVDNAAFSISNNSSPNGILFSNSPYFLTTSAAVRTASWDTASYPAITFWDDTSNGGITIGSLPGDSGSNFIDVFQSNTGPGQVFTLSAIPEPAVWAMMLSGFAIMGFREFRKKIRLFRSFA
jgi:hypothetical protein